MNKGPRAGKAIWRRFLAVLAEGGLNASSLAAQLQVSRQLLVNALQRGASMNALRAKEIHRLTGWPADQYPRITAVKLDRGGGQRKPAKIAGQTNTVLGLSYNGKRPRLSPAPEAPAAPSVARERKGKALH
jgi:hypothetical protein